MVLGALACYHLSLIQYSMVRASLHDGGSQDRGEAMDRTANGHTTRRPFLAGMIVVLIAVCLAPRPVVGCAFHTVLQRTVLDWFMDTSQAVLARPDMDSGATYVVVERLRGDAPSPRLNALVGTNDGYRLADNPDDAVLFVSDDGEQWIKAGYVESDLRPVLHTIIARSAKWSHGYDQDQLDLFSDLQVHPNPTIRILALGQIDRAPYALLRTIDLRFPVSDLRATLRSIAGVQYRPITVLLLGISGSAEARKDVHAYLGRSVDRDRAETLGAYATALIEMDEADGVAYLDSRFLADPRQPLNKLEHIVTAFAIHHDVGSIAVQDRIDTALRGFVASRPEGAVLVARQFGVRKNWSQAEMVEQLLKQRRIVRSDHLLPVAIYRAQARHAALSRSFPDRVE